MFIVAQIKQDFGLDVSVKDVEDLKDRFVGMYYMILENVIDFFILRWDHDWKSMCLDD